MLSHERSTHFFGHVRSPGVLRVIIYNSVKLKFEKYSVKSVRKGTEKPASLLRDTSHLSLQVERLERIAAKSGIRNLAPGRHVKVVESDHVF